MMYQIYAELSSYLLVIVYLVAVPVEKGILVTRIIGILNTFGIFVIQPLFYLTGDVNFRNRVSHQGLWKALKMELFQNQRVFFKKNQILVHIKFILCIVGKQHYLACSRIYTLRIVGYHFSSQLRATLNLCPIYLKLLLHVSQQYCQCSWDFKVNQIKIKGGCQSGRKVVTHDCKSDLPLVSLDQQII